MALEKGAIPLHMRLSSETLFQREEEFVLRYVISDIHGCQKEYCELLNRIEFSDKDELYILGDAADRGPEPIRVLKDCMCRPNVFYILGNHDVMMLSVLRPLTKEITEDSISDLPNDIFLRYADWMRNGGEVTFQQFRTLSRAEQEDILCYLEEASAYETLEHDGQLYILVHAGLNNFELAKEMDEYTMNDLIWEQADYDKQYFPGGKIYLVTGHTPTPLIRSDKKPLVYKGNGHIAIDCGCVFGGKLAAYCIETDETTYVDGKYSQENGQI